MVGPSGNARNEYALVVSYLTGACRVASTANTLTHVEVSVVTRKCPRGTSTKRPGIHPHGRTMARAEREPSLESLCLGVAGLSPQDCEEASRAAAATIEDCDAAAAALEECGAATLPVAAHVERAHACAFKVHSMQP